MYDSSLPLFPVNLILEYDTHKVIAYVEIRAVSSCVSEFIKGRIKIGGQQ